MVRFLQNTFLNGLVITSIIHPRNLEILAVIQYQKRVTLNQSNALISNSQTVD